jgi:predicted unusual protein kinase regulating ubiquinone biosynthesis (AarF/ABC1/UbiB family)
MSRKEPKGPIPTGWVERGAKLAGQTGLSAARFVGTRFRSFAAPDRAQEYLQGFHEQTARQLVEMLGEMKGAAMKLGQLASFYEFSGMDGMSTYRDALTMLQNSAPPMDARSSRRVIEEEFRAPVEDVFAEFEDEAVASASIGQVHRARLPTGEQVAVKVQYPGVDEAVRSDLKNVSALSKLAVAIAPNLDPREVAEEVRARVLEELDYKREAANQSKFAELYDGHPFIVVPKVFQDHCRRRVITQEFIEGRPFMSALDWPQAERDRLGEILFRFFYGSMNRFLLFSADPHPGNYLLLDRGKVAFLDFGLVRAIDPGTHQNLLEIIQALIANDKERERRALESLGILNARTPEIDAIWDHLVELNKPVLVDHEFKIDQAVVQKAAAAGFDPRSEAFQSLRRLGVPGIMVTFNRMSFGVHSLLGRLEATNNWRSIARELWEGATPKTNLGRREKRWLEATHPDWVPPLTRYQTPEA